jgi:hypothetical protein
MGPEAAPGQRSRGRGPEAAAFLPTQEEGRLLLSHDVKLFLPRGVLPMGPEGGSQACCGCTSRRRRSATSRAGQPRAVPISHLSMLTRSKFKDRVPLGASTFWNLTAWFLSFLSRACSCSFGLCTFTNGPIEIKETRPFIFFHQRKTAGSSARAAFREAAARLNLSSFIPCYDGVSCSTFKIPEKPFAVYAGHFPFSFQNHTFGLGSDLVIGNRPFNCATIVRRPTSRLLSCYYDRFLQENRSTLSFNDHTNVFFETENYYWKTCLNEPFRTFSPLNSIDNNDIFNNIGEHQDVLCAAKRRASQCFPVVLSSKKSIKLFDALFPQLSGVFSDLPRLNRNPRRLSCNASSFLVLKKITAAERQLYREVMHAIKMLYSISFGNY